VIVVGAGVAGLAAAWTLRNGFHYHGGCCWRAPRDIEREKRDWRALTGCPPALPLPQTSSCWKAPTTLAGVFAPSACPRSPTSTLTQAPPGKHLRPNPDARWWGDSAAHRSPGTREHRIHGQSGNPIASIAECIGVQCVESTEGSRTKDAAQLACGGWV
jgi:hypothetical protein